MGKDQKLTVLDMDVIPVVRNDKNGNVVVGDTQEFKIPQSAFHKHMEEKVPGFKGFRKAEKEALTEVAKECLTFLRDQTIAAKKASTLEISDDSRRLNYTVSGEKNERNPQSGETTVVYGKCSLRVSEKLPSVLRNGENPFIDDVSKAVAKAFGKK